MPRVLSIVMLNTGKNSTIAVQKRGISVITNTPLCYAYYSCNTFVVQYISRMTCQYFLLHSGT